MHHSNYFKIQLEGDNGSVVALDLWQLNPFRVAADDTARPYSNWARQAAEACPEASIMQIRSLGGLCRTPADSASDLATAIAEKMQLTVHLDGAIHGRFRQAHVTYSPDSRRWTDLETGTCLPTLSMLLSAVYARSPRARSSLILELPRQGEHRTVLQPTEHDLWLLRQAATGTPVDLTTRFSVWAKAGVTAEQLCLPPLPCRSHIPIPPPPPPATPVSLAKPPPAAVPGTVPPPPPTPSPAVPAPPASAPPRPVGSPWTRSGKCIKN